MRPNHVDLTGKDIGWGVVAGPVGQNRWGTWMWNVVCAHGASHVMATGNVNSGRIKGCRCIHAQTVSNGHKEHGHTKSGGFATREYATWQAMKDRCANQNNSEYENYGGRGISVCEQWSNSFEAFLADMGARPPGKPSIDRFPNKNGNYEPGNCRWATQKEQTNNRNGNVVIEFRGKVATVAEHLDDLGITNPGYVYSRLKSGWTVEDALLTPRGVRPQPLKAEA